ncbi:MAG: hypothetical protein BWZ03_00377 [bacterium ADurb.BinA186]|nr:MAG: hypothetical protein BWZ03_00377 [bacterium ADurb.BinA186]
MFGVDDLVFKFVGINTGWLEASALGIRREEVIAEQEASDRQAVSEFYGNSKGSGYFKNIRSPLNVKVLLPFKHLCIRYDDSFLEKPIKQIVSIAPKPQGQPLSKIFDDVTDPRTYEKIIELVARRMANFHFATLERNTRPYGNSKIDNLPISQILIKAKLHGDLKIDTIFLHGDTMELIDCEVMGQMEKLPISLEITYFLVSLERFLMNPELFREWKTKFMAAYFEELETLAENSASISSRELNELEGGLSLNFDIIKSSVDVLRQPHEFPSSIPQRNYENTVHYVWMGNLDTDQRKDISSLGPRRLHELAAKSNKTPLAYMEINMWVRANTIAAAQEFFKTLPGIKVRNLDDEFKNMSRNFFYHEQITRLFAILDKLEETRSYSMQADIVGLLVVAEFGGYYFDTTTFFKKLPNLFDNNLKKRIGLTEDKKSLPVDNELWKYPFAWTDLQVFSAPTKGDSVFVDTVRCILKEYDNPEIANKPAIKNLGIPHYCLIEEAHKRYTSPEQFPGEEFWDHVWQKRDDEYFELDLLKIGAGTWKLGKNANSDTGRISPYFYDRVRNAQERARRAEEN